MTAAHISLSIFGIVYVSYRKYRWMYFRIIYHIVTFHVASAVTCLIILVYTLSQPNYDDNTENGLVMYELFVLILSISITILHSVAACSTCNKKESRALNNSAKCSEI